MYLVDTGTLQTLSASLKVGRETLQFYRAFHDTLELQRRDRLDCIVARLAECAGPLDFVRWQRRVSAKYLDTPLSARGSARNQIGGRFNIGEVDPKSYQPFPALYLASDQATAHCEALSHEAKEAGTVNLDYALGLGVSHTVFAVSGHVEACIDLTVPGVLAGFIACIEDVRVPRAIEEWAEKLKIGITLIRDVKRLEDEMIRRNWQLWPMAYAVPTTSQVFGQLAESAGIEAIKYKSAWAAGECLVVFPRNFEKSSSRVELIDETPGSMPQTIRHLDKTTWTSLV